MEKQNRRSRLLLILGIVLLLLGAFLMLRHFRQSSSLNNDVAASNFNSYEDTGYVQGRISQISNAYENPENDNYYYFARINGLDIFLEANSAFANELEEINSLDTEDLIFTGTIKNLVYQDREFIQNIYQAEYPDLSINDNSPYLNYMLSNVSTDNSSIAVLAVGIFSSIIGLGLIVYAIFSMNRKEDEERAQIQAAIAQSMNNSEEGQAGNVFNLEQAKVNTDPVSLEDDSGALNKFFPKLQAYVEDSYLVKTSHDLRVNLLAVNSINLIPVYDNNDMYANQVSSAPVDANGNEYVNEAARIRNYALEFVYENDERVYLQLPSDIKMVTDAIKGFIIFISNNYPNISLSL